MHAKAGARIITHGSHTAPNSCQSAKFLPGSQRHGVHFVCPLTLLLEDDIRTSRADYEMAIVDE